MKFFFRAAHVFAFEMKHGHFVGKVLLGALVYFSASTLIINFRAIESILVLPYPVFIKIKILSSLITGAIVALSSFDLVVLIVLSFLFGINTILAVRSFWRQKKRFSFSFGTGLVSTVAVGCTSCGFSVLSLLGLGSAVSVLPFSGTLLSISAIAVLIFSIGYSLSRSTACATDSQNTNDFALAHAVE